jgi:hypothetical protein
MSINNYKIFLTILFGILKLKHNIKIHIIVQCETHQEC